MLKQLTYTHTKIACYLSYIVSAVINNFIPLLFVAFQKQFGLSLDQLAMLVALNFTFQILVDFFGAKHVKKIGYRNTLILALAFSCVGLCMIGVLPFVMNEYAGLLVAVLFYSTGSGLLEVMVSPTIEALPSSSKSGAMSLLHSFYCWGSVLVVLLSSLYFTAFGVGNWRYLCFLWAILPVLNIGLFLKVPIIPFGKDKPCDNKGGFFTTKIFWIFALLMLCAGASELAMSQWASYFAETGFNVSKTTGDLLGPCMFAVFMGIGRVMYALFSKQLNLTVALVASGIICILGYLVAVFVTNPVISLLGCGIVGLGSAVMWPGVLSLTTRVIPSANVSIYGYLAMMGDVGCSAGPVLVALAADKFNIMGSQIRSGLLCSIIFPTVLIAVLVLLVKCLKKYK